MLNKIKNYAIAILIIIVGVLAFIINCREPKVTKSVTYITTKSSFTGVTNATIKPNGEMVVSGTSVAINTSGSFSSQNTFSYNGIYAGISYISPDRFLGGVTYINRDFLIDVAYNPFNKEFGISARKSILTW